MSFDMALIKLSSYSFKMLIQENTKTYMHKIVDVEVNMKKNL